MSPSPPTPHGESQARATASAPPTAAGDPAAPTAPSSAPAASRGHRVSGSGRRAPFVAARPVRSRHCDRGLVVRGGSGVGRTALGAAATTREARAGVATVARATTAPGLGRRRRRLARAGATATAETRAAAASTAATHVGGRTLQSRVASYAAPGPARQGREAGAWV